MRAGFHAAKFHGKVAIAECPNGTTGTCANSPYPLTSANSPIRTSKARCTPVSTSHCWSSLGTIHTNATPIFSSATRKASISNSVSSVMFCCENITALTRLQEGGIQRKARGCSSVSPDFMPRTSTDHCHSAAKSLYPPDKKRIKNKSKDTFFIKALIFIRIHSV